MIKHFLYKGDNKSFWDKHYVYDGGAFFNKDHAKLPTLEELEVSKAYFEGKVVAVERQDQIIADYAYVYGTRAKDVYEKMCDRFGWKRYLSGNFARQKKLYAENATPEGYAVWFAAHSNWTSTSCGVWNNTIVFGDRIDESWPLKTFYSPKYVHTLDEVRVVFARRDYEYTFIGVYKCVGWKEIYDDMWEEKRMLKTYKLISKIGRAHV